ncbi:MAG: hypothetical protein ACRD0B_08350, partial [Acidimicrobiales bacterium]
MLGVRSTESHHQIVVDRPSAQQVDASGDDGCTAPAAALRLDAAARSDAPDARHPISMTGTSRT